MAGSSLLMLIDDIATLLDDVAVMSKVAVKKTAGVLGDDLALNAEQVSGVKTDRELPVVWAVAVGSLKNKAILVPAALLISYFVPALITPLLMIGGAFLCFEGFEKVFHKFFHHEDEGASHAKQQERVLALADPTIDVVALEKEKIAGAIRTDFILSAEIIVISLGTVAGAAFGKQVAVLVAVALLITVGVYGLVAGIVKLDDVGLYLSRREGESVWVRGKRRLGGVILWVAPYLMRALGIAGTIAMFLVGGGIITHGIPPLAKSLHHLEESAAGVSSLLGGITGIVAEGLVGVVAGGILVAIWTGISKLRR